MASVHTVSHSFMERQRGALVEKMKTAFTKQINAWNGSVCAYIPADTSQAERAAMKHEDECRSRSVNEAAMWAAEKVRRQEDPENDLTLRGWTIRSVREHPGASAAPTLVQESFPKKGCKSRSDWYSRVRDECTVTATAPTDEHNADNRVDEEQNNINNKDKEQVPTPTAIPAPGSGQEYYADKQTPLSVHEYFADRKKAVVEKMMGAYLTQLEIWSGLHSPCAQADSGATPDETPERLAAIEAAQWAAELERRRCDPLGKHVTEWSHIQQDANNGLKLAHGYVPDNYCKNQQEWNTRQKKAADKVKMDAWTASLLR